MRQKRKTALAIIAAILTTTLVAGLVYRHFLARAEQTRHTSPAITLKLPFTIPCAIDSHDAEPVYAAFRKRDRALLSKLFADKRFVAVQRGDMVRITKFGQVSMILSDTGSESRARVCFVPAYMIPVIRDHTSN